MSADLSPEEFQRLRALFERAADLPRVERMAFVERECGSNATLRAELESALEGLAGPDVLGRIQGLPAARAGLRIGPYQLLEKIGEGGMGEVYAAEQLAPVVRRVALKLIKPGMDSALVVARFEAERQALARMSHANIAQVYDGGTTESGSPYFVMEYVAGQPINEYCDRRKLSTRERLELFIDICEGVQYAHQKGVIHRDLKPSNLLVMQQEGRGVPKIIDFGVARATTGRLGERTLHTMVGQIIGTLDYMSPEQANPTATDIDTRSDIYSLGVVLYQLLSGLLPFEHQQPDQPLSEVQRLICETDPPTPSTRLKRHKDTSTTLAPLRGTDERSLVRQLSGDLDWICMKALEKDPARRYPSASELAADLRRHLALQPVLAGRPGAFYRAGKFLRRNRVGVTAGLVVALGTCVGIYGYVDGRLEAAAASVKALQLSGVLQLQQLELEADGLWPPHPQRIPAMESWLESARALSSNLEEYRATLEANARHLSFLNEAPDDAALLELGVNLERFRNGLLAEDTITEDHGWSVPKRLTLAKRLRDGIAEGGEWHERWQTAFEAIRTHPDYGGLTLAPQVGLVPIGPDDDSGLWEFWHVATGAEPKRDEQHRLQLTGEMGVVLVLVPGGSFTMGAQSEDEQGENFDPYSKDHSSGNQEGPLVRVTLEPYFISKFEMTRGQWERATGSTPSHARMVKLSPTNPVGWVDWNECHQTTSRLGLALPSEEQWEYAARATTTTIWSTGNGVNSLQGYANVYDSTTHAYSHNSALDGQAPDSDIEDGFATIAPVGSLEPNPWGLHDVHGNVMEGCSNSPYTYGNVPADPRETGFSTVRGGCNRLGVFHARSAVRRNEPLGAKAATAGLRPMRAIDP